MDLRTITYSYWGFDLQEMKKDEFSKCACSLIWQNYYYKLNNYHTTIKLVNRTANLDMPHNTQKKIGDLNFRHGNICLINKFQFHSYPGVKFLWIWTKFRCMWRFSIARKRPLDISMISQSTYVVGCGMNIRRKS